MLRWLTAGESHGPALVGIIEGVPAGVELTSAQIADALARRRLGYGRGARMKFEQDVVTILGGVRHGLTQGGPVAIQVGNTEWPKWEQIMSCRSRGPGNPRRPGPQRPADPPAARPRRLHRHAEVRLRRGPPGAGARQRPRDGHPGGPRHGRRRVPQAARHRARLPHRVRSPASPSRKAGRCRSRAT